MSRNEMKKRKQIVSMVLCFVLVMSHTPTTALVVQAAETMTAMGSDITPDITPSEPTTTVITPSKPVMTTARYDLDGDKAYDEVYEIGTAEEFYWFAGLVNGTLDGVEENSSANAVLTADITVNKNLLSSLEFDTEGKVANGEKFIVWEPVGNDNGYYEGIFDGNNHTVSGLYFNNAKQNKVGMFGWSFGKIRNVDVRDSYFRGCDCVGGVLGSNHGSIENCNNEGEVVGTYYVGGVLGENYGSIENCNNEGEVAGTYYVGGVLGRNYENGSIKNCNNEGEVAGDTVVGGVLGYNSGSIEACNNGGEVAGNYEVGGVLGYNSENGSIENCSNEGKVAGNDYVGGVLGYNSGSIEACNNGGEVAGEYYVGGVLGYNSGSIANCNNEGEVAGEYYVGGVLGGNFGSIANCNNEGDVAGSDDVGGVLGLNSGSIANCNNEGDVAGDYSVGGVLGLNYENGSIKKCNNEGEVAGTNCVGGVLGWNYENGSIENCNNGGEVAGSDGVGGVLGNNYGSIKTCNNEGDVAGSDYVGGVLGHNSGNGTMENCYNNGEVAGSSSVGAVAGYNDGSIKSCYYNKEKYEGDAVAENAGTLENIEGKTSEEFKEYSACTVVGYHMGGVATCQKGKICSSCGETYDENLNPENHEKTEEDICEQISGNISLHNRTCTYDGEKYTEKHTFDSSTGKCEACGYQAAASVSYAINSYKQVYMYHSSLKSAFSQAQEKYPGSVVTMYTDATIENESDSITIADNSEEGVVLDLNGCTLSSSVNAPIKVSNGVFTMKDSKTGGSIKADTSGDTAVTVENSGVLNIEGGIVSTVFCSSGTLNLSGNPVISSLKTGDNGVVYLISDLTEGASIGLDNSTLGAVVVQGTDDYTITESDEEKFYCTSENSGLKPTLEENQLMIKRDIATGVTTLSQDKYIYTGFANEPEVTVEISQLTTSESNAETTINLEENTDYSVSYSSNINAGTATVTIEGMGNYTGTVTREFTITQAPLTIKAEDKSMTYGESLPEFTYTVDGFMAEDELLTEPVVSCKADETSAAGTYSIVVSEADAGSNYEITYKTGTLTIGKATTAPNMPGTTMNVANSCKKVGDVSLPEKWIWNEADKETALETGVAVTATAIYDGEDKGNYKTESVTVSITRNECEHKTEIRNAKEATCKEAGYTGDTYCKLCDTKTATGKVIEKLTTHSWNQGEVTKEATCTEAGEKTYTCTICETTKTEETEKKEHLGGTATCTKKAVCDTCKQEYGELDKTNHGETEVKNAKEATCKEAGYTGDTYCKDCGEKTATGEVIEKLTTHTWNEGQVTKEATCTEAGEKTYTCTVCETTKTEETEKKEHIGGTATCTKKAVCDTCKQEYGELDKTNHGKTEVRDAKEATSTEAGYTGDTYCKDCGVKISDGKVIPALDEIITPEKPKTTVTPTPVVTLTPTLAPTLTPTSAPILTPTTKPVVTQKVPKKGAVLTDKKTKAKYKVVVSDAKNGTVEYVKSTSKNVTNVTISAKVTIDGITYKVVSIGKNAFKNNKKLTKVTIGSNITTIGANAFSGCKKLKTVKLSKNITTIGDKAFYKCTSLTKITIPAKVKKIGKQSFYGCKKLKTITIKTTKLTTKNVGSKAFKGIYKKATIKVPKSKVKAYKKVLKTKGIGTQVKVKK